MTSNEVEYVNNEPQKQVNSSSKKTKKKINHVEDGDILVVDKERLPQKEIVEISHNKAEQIRPKKELTEKQKVALQALIERNKKRFEELRRSKDVVKNPEELTEIEEDKVLVVVKPKRKYTKKLPMEAKKKVVVLKNNKKVVEDDPESEIEEVEDESEEEESESLIQKQLLEMKAELDRLKAEKEKPRPAKVVHKYSGLSIF